jgi:hypothetical protein
MSVLLIDRVSSFLSTYFLLYLLSVGVGTFFHGLALWHCAFGSGVCFLAFTMISN